MMLAPDRHTALGTVKEEIMHPKLLASFVVVLLVAVVAFGFRDNADAQKTKGTRS